MEGNYNLVKVNIFNAMNAKDFIRLNIRKVAKGIRLNSIH